MLDRLGHAGEQENAMLALHSATREKRMSHSNLDSLEIYLLDPKKRTAFEKLLELEPQERGYNVLLIEPYYKSWIKRARREGFRGTPDLLTYLDLASYPLRGREQADYLLQKSPELKALKNAK